MNWVDKSGQEHSIRSLTDDHLTNILKMLYKPSTADTLRSSLRAKIKQEERRMVNDAGSMFDNPAALATADEIDRLTDLVNGSDLDVIKSRWPQLPHLEFEARRRGLVI